MTNSPINFNYAFAEPHRICVCLPESSNKTLFDCTKESLMMLWSDGNTKNNPLGAYKRVRIDWKVKITAKCNDTPMEAVSWERIEGYIPSLRYKMQAEDTEVVIDCIATSLGDVLNISIINNSNEYKNISLDACVLDNTVNTKWVDFDCEFSVVNPIFNDASDRIVIMDANITNNIPRRREAVSFTYSLKPKESSKSKLIRPNKKYNEDIKELINTDWDLLSKEGLNAWKEIVKKAPVFSLPDSIVENAYKACLCDIFVMREEQADGRIAGLAGTEMYRSANTGEPCFQSLALGKYGFFEQAKENIEFVAQFQIENGSWEDDKQWGKYMWATSGWKSHSIKQYYLRTRNKKFLEENFERMLRSAKWSKEQRDKIKQKKNPEDPEWGLMPRGMGDCGLKDNDDLFGVFYPHNFLHCMGIEIAAWSAKELGRDDEYARLNSDYLDYKECIIKSLDKAHIREDDKSIWIGSSPNNKSGSRWGVADVVYPSNILPVNHPLAVGTMKKLQSNISQGGLPKNLGWIPDGLWVAISLDAMAYVNILAGNADLSANYLIAAINHGTPLYTWCEERTEEKGAIKITGDLQHAWTPICITQFVRDMLISDHLFNDDILHITPAVPRYFYKDGNTIEVKDAPTYWGNISFTIKRNNNTITFIADLKSFEKAKNLQLDIRIPDSNKNIILKNCKGAKCSVSSQTAILKTIEDTIEAVFIIE